MDACFSSSFKTDGFSSIEFKQVRIPDISTDRKLFGVLGFSVMFNSPLQLAATAGIIGAIANTTRLELVDLASFPPAAAAFLGALLAGLLASMIKTSIGYPRISLTVPSIVIMVPGLYLYRAIYNIGITSINTGAFWFTEALLIIMALPLGLIFARVLQIRRFDVVHRNGYEYRGCLT